MGDFHSPPEVAAAFNDLAARVSALERTRTIPTGAVAPTGASADGAMQGQGGATPRLWLRIDGNWKSTAVS